MIAREVRHVVKCHSVPYVSMKLTMMKMTVIMMIVDGFGAVYCDDDDNGNDSRCDDGVGASDGHDDDSGNDEDDACNDKDDSDGNNDNDNSGRGMMLL